MPGSAADQPSPTARHTYKPSVQAITGSTTKNTVSQAFQTSFITNTFNNTIPQVFLSASNKSNYITLSVGHQSVAALVDTGASVSCVTKKLLSLSGLKNVIYDKSDIVHVTGIGGQLIDVLGTVILPVRINKLIIPHKFYVFNALHKDIVLGLDFLNENDVDILLSKGCISIKNGLVETPLLPCPETAPVARVIDKIVIQPRTEMIIPVKLPSDLSEKSESIILDTHPTLTSRTGLIGARCIATTSASVPYRLINPSNACITLTPRQPVACCYDMTAGAADIAHIDHVTDHTVCPTDINTSQSVNYITDLQHTSDHVKVAEELGVKIQNDNLTSEQKTQLMGIIGKNRDVFATSLQELGTTNLVEHKIDTDNAVPTRQRFYRTTPKIKLEIERQCKEMEEHDIIEPAPSSPWSSPVVMVKKRSGEYRFAVDFRKVNSVTKPLNFPLPRLDDVLDSLGQSKSRFYSNLDCFQGFWQISVAEEDRDKTAFTTHHGIWRFKKMPFGLAGSPATFSMVMARALSNINWKNAMTYVDDIIIFSSTFEQHLIHLQNVFDNLRKAQLKLKPSKCNFAASRVSYLGHIITSEGVTVDSEKVEAVAKFPLPKDEHELRSYLGLCGYYRRFIRGYSHTAAPLFDMLKKVEDFVWTEERKGAFQTLKDCLISAPVLAYPNMQKPFRVTTDASSYAIGYILSQVNDDGEDHPIAYGGRSLHPTERRYSVSERECLSVVEAIKAYHPYIADSKFTVITDHASLRWLRGIKLGLGRLARWAVLLQAYQFDIVHRPGTSIAHADSLSRRPYSNDETKQAEQDQDDVFDSIYPLSDPIKNDLDICINHVCELDSVEHGETEAVIAHIHIEDANSNTPLSVSNPYGTAAAVTDSTSQHTSRGSIVPPQTDLHTGPAHTYTPASHLSIASEHSLSDNKQPLPNNLPPDIHIVALLETHITDVQTKQNECADISPIKCYIEDNVLPESDSDARKIVLSADQYVVENSILYHLYQPRLRVKKSTVDDDNNNLQRHIKQLVIPRVMRSSILQAYHDCLLGGGHKGPERTYAAIRAKYYWPRMYTDVFNYAKHCHSCQESKNLVTTPLAPLHPLPVEQLFSRWHIDILGPLTTTTDGFKYVLVIIESFSKWCELIPLKSQEATDIAWALYTHIFTRYGAPTSLISDRGANFLAKVVQAFCNLFNVARYMTTPYHPQCNAQCERLNSVIQQTLRAYIDKDHDNWPRLLPAVAMTYRMTPSTRCSQFSPFYLLFGQEMRTPFDTSLPVQPELPARSLEHYQEVVEHLNKCRALAQTNVKVTQQRDKARHDGNVKERPFRVGDRVLLKQSRKTPGRSPKLCPKWVGPLYVTGVHSRNTVSLRWSQDDRDLRSRVNVTRLRKYYEPKDRAITNPTPEPTPEIDVTPQSESQTPDTPAAPCDHQQWFEAERLIKQRGKGSKKQFLVRWKGGDPDSWEPTKNLTPALLREFYIAKDSKRRRKRAR